VLRPERALGPDGVITKFPFQILFASKTTYRVNQTTKTRKSVDTRDINENERSLKFQNFFSEKDEGNKKPSERSRSERKQAVFNWYVNAKLQGIFRLHFILPYATTSNQHNFKPGTITLSKCNIGKGCQVQIATVDIDSSCFKICDIFGHKTLELLKKKYPIKENEKEKQKWIVKSELTDEEFNLDVDQTDPDNNSPLKKQTTNKKNTVSEIQTIDLTDPKMDMERDGDFKKEEFSEMHIDNNSDDDFY